MSYEPRLIAPYFKESGLNLYFKPWIIGDDAFVEADDDDEGDKCQEYAYVEKA